MLEAEGPQGSYRKVENPHFIDEKFNGTPDTLIYPHVSEACILTPPSPLFWGLLSSCDGGCPSHRCKQSKEATKLGSGHH